MIKLKELVKEVLTIKDVQKMLPDADQITKSGNVFTARLEHFYTFGKTDKDFRDYIQKEIPNAEIIDSGDIWKPFKGGAPVHKSSHWFVKFRIKETK